MAIDPGAAKAEFDALPVMFQHHAMKAYHAMRDDQRRHEPIREFYRQHHYPVHSIYEVGDFTIVEISDRPEAKDPARYFVVWRNGCPTSDFGDATLDQALLSAVADKYGSRGNVSYWIGRMIGMFDPKETQPHD